MRVSARLVSFLLALAVASAPGSALAEGGSGKFKKESQMSSGLLKPQGDGFSRKTRKSPEKSTFIRSNSGESQSSFKQGLHSTPSTKFTPTSGSSASDGKSGQSARSGSGSSRSDSKSSRSGSSRAESKSSQAGSRSSSGHSVSRQSSKPPARAGGTSAKPPAQFYRDRLAAFGPAPERVGVARQLSEGETVAQLPAGAKGAIPIVSGGQTYYRYDGIYFREVRDAGGTYYVISDRIP
jgi:hypothetical protein